ncbi:hypothetical protein AAA413_03170, partial [Lactobacillus crispatus]|uniref:hypothetical protein n=1 Tax=Lactobacillus crispatus TaxID=47770 RepID=UPI0030FA9607
RWLKGRFLLLKILKRTKKRSRFLKKEILIVFIHLEASFFPDTGVIIVSMVLKMMSTWATSTFVLD